MGVFCNVTNAEEILCTYLTGVKCVCERSLVVSAV